MTTSHGGTSGFGGVAARSHRLLAAGLDGYLVFKHEESAAGALEVERLLKAA